MTPTTPAPTLVIDTGPLFDATLWETDLRELTAFRQDEIAGAQTLRSRLRYLQSRLHYDAFLRLRKGFRLATWSGALAELRYLARPAIGGQHAAPPRAFWTAWDAIRRTLELELVEVPAKALPLQLLIDLGPVDAALLELARRLRHEGSDVQLVSIDTRLLEASRAEGVREFVLKLV